MYRLLVTGDLMVGEITKLERERVLNPVAKLINSFNADEVLGNLEVPLTERGFPSDKRVYWRSPPITAQDLKKMGFTMLSLATNHTLDYGVEGLLDTIDILDHEKIKRVGAGRNLDEALKPILISEDNGNKIAIISVTCTLPGNTAASNERPGAAPIRIRTLYEFDTKKLEERPGFPPYIHTEPLQEDVQRIIQIIKGLKQNGYFVIVAVHWGDSYQKNIAEYQHHLARLLIQGGCNFILGHHPHTFHAIEVLNNVPAMYSVGNFIRTKRLDEISKNLWSGRSKDAWKMTTEALVGVLEFENSDLMRIEIYPIIIDDGIPCLATGDNANRILSEVEQLSEGLLTWNVDDHKGVIHLKH